MDTQFLVAADTALENRYVSCGELRLARLPPLIQSTPCVPQAFTLTPYENRAMTAMLCQITGVAIENVKPMWRYGCVSSFDVTPAQRRVPLLVWCPKADLREFYILWRECSREPWGVENFSGRMDSAIRQVLQSARNLTRGETVFLMVEMLQFKNAILSQTQN